MQPGTSISHYRIISLMGKGGMGEVYLASDSDLDRKVAIKVLGSDVISDPQRLNRFIQEAKTASALNHPNIITIYEIGRLGTQPFIVMEFIEGHTLRRHLSEHRLTVDEILAIAMQMVSALAEAHQAGIVHRDIKPENVMVRTGGLVKVLDFGLAKLVEKPVTALNTQAPTQMLVKTDDGVVVGTTYYMSPEQLRGLPVDERTDVWSLGVVLYEMLTGTLPFTGPTTTDVMISIAEKQPAPLARYAPEVPAELQRIISKTLAKDREERYQNTKDLLIDLKRLKQQVDLDTAQEYAVSSADRPKQQMLSARTISEAHLSTAQSHAPSSAEYIVSGIKSHQKAAILIVAAVLAIALIAYFSVGRSRRGINSLAVMPLSNEGGDPNIEYMSDGLTESLINSLSELPNVKVISFSSVMRYKGQQIDPQVVGNELGVGAMLVGRIVKHGNSLSISTELVDTIDKSHIWGASYDRSLPDLLAVREEIATEVSSKLRVRLSGEEKVRRPETKNNEAYELYLKGKYFQSKRTEADLRQSIDYFQEAVIKDPNYAQAYGAMANSYLSLGGVLGFSSPRDEAPRARTAAMRALEIDEGVDDAHLVLAELKLHDWDWSGAESEYKKTIDLNPNNADAHGDYGTYLEALGRFDEAIAERERSRQLNPVVPIAIADVGYPKYYARRYDEALVHYRKALEMDPNFSWGHLWIGQVYVQQHQYEKAFDEIKKAVALSNNNVRDVATLGHAYAVAGNRDEALKILNELQQPDPNKYVSPFFIALIYTGLGDKEQAFAWLEKAYEERHPYLILIKVEPVFDSLHSDPRFANLTRRIGLP